MPDSPIDDNVHAFLCCHKCGYKDIGDVMELQADLVTPTVRLTPLAVVKG